MSTIKANFVQNASGGATTLTDLYPARAWSTFNGQGTVSIIVSEGISSITDNGTGVYTLNLSNSTTTAYQVICGSGLGVSGQSYNGAPVGRNDSFSNATSNVPCYVAKNAGSSAGPPYDSPQVHVVIVA